MPEFNDKRCFLPNVNKKISEECPENYTFNPNNEHIKVRYRELTKGSYSLVTGLGSTSAETEENESSSGSMQTNSQSSSSNSSSSSSSASSNNSKQEAVQLYPQEISLKLRINEVQKIKIEYAQAEDYPVDLYYLMDLSNSMKDDKKKFSDLGQLLVESMSNITSNFRLGFGSFVGVSMVPKVLEEPCDGCAAPYGYRNHMPLSQNTTRFATEVRDAPVYGNLDAPEGGFDAIMQAIVCRDEIGWRQKALKLLLFSTNAGFHYAGDGKLGGIVKPNDGCCHMDKKGMYTHSTLQDYPSISQINLKAKENSINIIWAVTEEQIKIYSNLTNLIEGSYAAKLSNDSSNIVDLVRDQYNAITSSLEMKDTASNHVNLKYYSSCLGDGPLVETNKCDGLKVGNKIEFTVEVKVPACPENSANWKQKFLIYPVGINESLTVNLEMLCDCDCEHADSLNKGFERNSLKCDGHGDLACGVCTCHDDYFGKNCECNPKYNGQNTNGLACRPNNTTTNDCSGRGRCDCNVCYCFDRDDPLEVVFGKYCECDNFSCDRNNKLLCSGEDHGTCNCGVCECNDGWSGKMCECSTDKKDCYDKVSGLECAGHGVCECGKCKYNSEDEHR
jgi:integrin beta 1